MIKPRVVQVDQDNGEHNCGMTQILNVNVNILKPRIVHTLITST